MMTYLVENYDSSWATFFATQKELLNAIDTKLYEEAQKVEVYPPKELVFEAFRRTPRHAVRVVLLGQDPYHGAHEAEGLAFSVPQGVAIPPSLRNIFKELQADQGCVRTTPHLGDWADQGVFLLNSFLTVQANCAGSHKKMGWEDFTDAVISTLSAQREPLLFVLWGSFARKKRALIDTQRHTILEGCHPSPLSAYRGFFGSTPFSTINQWLVAHKYTPILWGDMR